MRMLVGDVQSVHNKTSENINTAIKDTFIKTGQFDCECKKISLKQYTSNNNLDLKSALKLMIQITTLLGDIHGTGRVLKHLTPESIVIDLNERVVTFRSEVGHSTSGPDEQKLFDPDFQKNVLPYLSPESTGRVKGQIDYRADFYSTGVIFYELLTQKLPFPISNPLEMIHAHIAKVPQPLNNPDRLIPKVISDIVLKLLSKVPDDRYQSIWGLLKDLVECRQRLGKDGRIEPFELGMDDMVMLFRRPSILVGREKEVNRITNAYDRAESGERVLVLISGEPGAGKTALSVTLRTKIEEKGGFFIYGNNEQSDRNTPYFSVIKAFQRAVKRLLSGSEESIQNWREKLNHTLGTNGAVITEVLPEIELITGPQPRLPDVGPEETMNRFKRVFGSFVGVFASQEHPLVIFLDDLQWADSGSIELVHDLITDPGIGFLMIIGTFRDTEVDILHPLSHAINNIHKKHNQITTLTLSRLSTGEVYEILQGFYKIRGDKAWELAELIQNKTQGNPFFINQFIKNLYEKNLFKPDSYLSWRWDLGRILKMQVTENVVELLEEKINQLSESVVGILKICACIGNGFKAELVAVVNEKPLDSIKKELTLIVTEGFLNYDYGSERYRFEHERIRETVYSLTSQEQKEKIHHTVGQILRARYYEEQQSELIFPIVHHLKIGKELLKSKEELRILLEYTVMAGEQAKQANAYKVAAAFFEDAATLLPDNSWRVLYKITYRCYSGLAICHYLSLNFERAEDAFNTAIINTKNDEDKAYLYNVKAIMVANQGYHEDAVELCLKGLRKFGFEIPYNAGRLNLLKEMVKTRVLIGFKSPDDFLNLPELKGKQNALIIELAMTLLESSFFVNPKLQALVNLVMIQFFIKNGINDKAAFFFMTYAYFLIAGIKSSPAGIAFGEMAMKMNRKYKNAHIQAKLSMIHAITIRIRKVNMDEAIKELESAFTMSLESGDFRYGMYAEQCILFTMISKGISLGEIESVYKKNYDFLVKTRDSGAVSYNDSVRQTIKCLRGETRSPAHLDDADFYEKKHIKKMKNDNIPIILQRHFLLRLMVLYIMGYYEDAYEAAKKCSQYRDSSVGLVTEDDRSFYTALSILGLYRQQKKISLLKQKKLSVHLKQLLHCAVTCPVNFLHKYLLVQAYISSITGRLQKDHDGMLQGPENLFSRAIQLATENGFLLDAAIACEGAMDYFHQGGVSHMARYYFKKAIDGFGVWGATVKIRQLEQTYPELMSKKSLPDHDLGRIYTNTFDYKAMVNSLQMISTEIVLERLLKNLMKVIAENAGAERAVFISLKDDQVNVEAELNLGNFDKKGGYKIFINQVPVDEKTDILFPVVNLVRRTGEYIVLDNAMEQGDFIDHRYVKTKKIKSILCLPIMRQFEPVALLYLENNLAAGVFTMNRIEILQLVASQAAISFENSRLYERVSSKEVHLRMLADKLRSLVSELVQTEERERRKIAVELHDHLGHALANIRISLGILGNSTENSENMGVFKRIRGLVDRSITDVQSLTFELSPPVLYDLGLEGAIDWLAFNTARQHGLKIHYDDSGEKIKMDDSIRALLFRSVRELLFNIVKHAKAKNVTILSYAKDEFISIQIKDDGVGFLSDSMSDSIKEGGGFGLFSIQERLAIYGGRLDIQTALGNGTKVKIVAPLHSEKT